jgi:Arm DNA-binding domain
MPRIKLTKSAIDALPTPSSDVVYCDAAYPGFGVTVTPKGRKVFIVLYRTGGAGSHLRKTSGPRPQLSRAHIQRTWQSAASYARSRHLERGTVISSIANDLRKVFCR